MPRTIVYSLMLMIALTAVGTWALAQSEPAGDEETDAPATTSDDEPSAEDVLNDLMQRRRKNRLIEPTRPQPTVRPGEPADPALAGVAPGDEAQAPLRREGQFIITRRGRMTRAPGGSLPWMFVFESDSEKMVDRPMYLLPCQLLEDMEQIIEQRSDAAEFVLSGKIFVYHGANYLLPTLMKLAPDRGNLEN